MKKVFLCNEGQIYRFLSKQEKLLQSNHPQTLTGHFYLNEESLLTGFFDRAKSLLINQPLIVYVTNLTDAVKAQFNTQFGTKLKLILTKDVALAARKTAHHEGHVVWLITTEFSRGYDLKLAKRANVCVVDNKPSISVSLTDVEQMVGRSTRDRGDALGDVFVVLPSAVNSNSSV